ncbi:MAG: RHS repeat-associated core domain-containing protein, partial [Bacteroidota bacterium]
KYPFGMQMPGRTLSASSYRYGFNGKEKDSNGEWGSQTHYDYGFRIYNPQIAKFLSVDPLMTEYPFYTPYQFASNSPILAVDIDGLEADYLLNLAEKFVAGAAGDDPNAPLSQSNTVTNTYLQKENIVDPRDILKAIYNDPQGTGRQVVRGIQEGLAKTKDDLSSGEPDRIAYGLGQVYGTAAEFVVPSQSFGKIFKIKIRPNLSLPKESGITINSPIRGLDIRPAEFVEKIPHGAKIDELVQRAVYETRATGAEHAIIQLTDGTRHLVSGGRHGIELPSNTDILFGHTHPPVRSGELNTPSVGDREALDALDQSKQFIFHDGQRTTIYRGKDSSFDTSTTDY